MIRPLYLASLLSLLLLGCGPSFDESAVVVQALAAAPAIRLPFGEPDGDMALDVSGNANHGTLRGPERVRDELGRALRFDGRNDYVRVPESRELNITEIGRAHV